MIDNKEAVGRCFDMAKEVSGEFEDILAEHISDREFYERGVKGFYLLEAVNDNSDGHGVTLVIRRDAKPSRLDRHLRNAQPYNGINHNLYDHDITDIVMQRREKDLATIVDASGDISGSGVYLPGDDVAYQEKYGIGTDISTFMGFDPKKKTPGGRTISALCASDLIGESVLILTLGETSPEGEKGEINAYFRGDRIYNSAGREMHWEEYAARKPKEAKVLKLPVRESQYAGQAGEAALAYV